MEIRVMARRGMRIREIARELECSRNTVKRYLRDGKALRYGPRQPRGIKLDPFKDSRPGLAQSPGAPARRETHASAT